MSEKFCLKWNDFESNVSKSFGLLRNEEYLHDVTLVCDDNSQVSAHKLVLSACSEYFKTIFRNNSHPNPLICLEGVTLPDLRNIMDYIYNGEANIFQENLDNFLSIAQRLKISGLLQSDLAHESKPDNLDWTEEFMDYTESKSNKKENLCKDSSRKTLTDRNQRNIDEGIVSLVNGDQEEIDKAVDEHIESFSDGNLKCSICGKLAKTRQNIRAHVETHLEGISYPCPSCEKTFRSRNAVALHKSRFHK